MTRTLQKKFIVTAMIAVTVLLVLLLGGLNIFNALSSANESQRLLQILVRNEANRGRFQPPAFGDPASPDGEWTPDGLEPPAWDDAGQARFDLENFSGEERQELEEVMERGGLFSGQLTVNDARSAIYFTVRFLSSGTSYADVSRIADVSEEDAVSLAEACRAAGQTEGKAEGYLYRAETDPAGTTTYVFLSTGSQTGAVLRVVLLSLLLGAAAWGLMLLLVILLSKRAIRPIAENMEKQRRFVTDAGHEIKTPLAIIQANTEAMELRTGENKYTKNIRGQVARLSGLMQDLLTLAKADESRTAETATLFSFSELVRATAESFQAPMELRGLQLSAEIAPELTLKGDRTLLARLVSILMDNAVKYASEGSVLQLRLEKGEKWASLTLANRCDALPDCAPEKLFDRFYRADEARTQTSGGYGIGLSAAQAIAAAHRGSLNAAYSEDNCITFTVKLPMK